MERIELFDESQEDYLEYRVIHEDGSEGYASLTIRDLYDGSPHFMAYQLRNETLPDNAKVAELFLYPPFLQTLTISISAPFSNSCISNVSYTSINFVTSRFCIFNLYNLALPTVLTSTTVLLAIN